jgi:hypothetical protein
MLMSPSLPPWDSTNFSDCTNMPPEPQAGVVDAAFVGGEHLDEAAHDAGRRVELAAVLALGAGEAGEEVFVDAAQQIDGAVGLLALAGGGEFDGGDDVDEFAEALLVEAGAGVVLGQRRL